MRSFPLLMFGLCACTELPALRLPPHRELPPPRAVSAPEAAAARGMVRAGTPAEVDIVKAREKGAAQLFSWQSWSKEAFEQAKRERRFVLIHGAAVWCHWCHVMEETTYRDPRVGALIRDHFVAIRVDIDSRPDIAERYGDWGWPATVVLGPDAEELGKFRGYLPADEMLEKLTAAEQAAREAKGPAVQEPRAPASIAALPWIGAEAARNLDGYYDAEQGSWGMRQKVALGDDVCFELLRAAHGDDQALARALFTLDKEAQLIDPVWGGVYQYSAARDWGSPHYEKLMPFQAQNLAAYARAYERTKDPRQLERAKSIAAYLDQFMSSPAGAFFVSQDADVGAHDPKAAFIDGDVYYRLPDAGRRKLGIPRVDDHVYADANGMAIAAYAALFEATGDTAYRQRAERAADAMLKSHVGSAGAVVHDAQKPGTVEYLADAAQLGFGLARLAEAIGPTDSAAAAYRDAARRVAETAWQNMAAADGALYAQSVDPDAAGVFAHRREPFAENVAAARLAAALGRLGESGWRDKAQRVLAAIATPAAIAEQGRFIGVFLLALDEAGALKW